MQNAHLLLHVPDQSFLDAETAVSWQLFDRQSMLLGAGTGRLSAAGEVPRAGRTVLVIPARRIVCIETPLPPVSAQKRDALLRYAIEDKLTIDPATVHAVVLGMSGSPASNNHVVAAIDRAWFASVLRWLSDAGIAPAQAVSAAALIPVADGEWSVVLDGAHGVAQRPDGFAYSFDVNTQDGLTAHATRIPQEPPFALALALKEARDKQLSPSRLSVFVDQAGDQPADVLWVAAWQRSLDCPVRVAAKTAPMMVTSRAGNLLSGEFAPPNPSRGWLMVLKPALTVGAMIAILQLAFTIIDAWRLDQRRRTLENEMTQVFKTAFPGAQAIVNPPLQMQRNLQAMQRERGLNGLDDARLLLAQLTAIIKSVPNLTPTGITIGEGSVTVEALVADRQQQTMLQSRAGALRGTAFAVDPAGKVRLTIKAER